MPFTVYLTPDGDAGVIHAGQAIPARGSEVMTTEDALEASEAVVKIHLGARGEYGEMLRHRECGLPVWPDGQGGWTHREAADETFCGLIFGGAE